MIRTFAQELTFVIDRLPTCRYHRFVYVKKERFFNFKKVDYWIINFFHFFFSETSIVERSAKLKNLRKKIYSEERSRNSIEKKNYVHVDLYLEHPNPIWNPVAPCSNACTCSKQRYSTLYKNIPSEDRKR